MLRDLIVTVEEVEQKQKMAAAEGDNTDIFACYAEPPLAAVNVFHLRNGRIVDRHEYFWEDAFEFAPDEFFTSLLMQFYGDQAYIPSRIHVPVELEDREVLEELLAEKSAHKVEIHTPRRGEKRAMLALAETNARHSFEQRFRVRKPTSEAIQEALREVLGLEEAPRRIECFDISHIQGSDIVASMVVWEDGRMKKSDYRKFIMRTVASNDDFASMREVITRRYSRLEREGKPRAGPGAGGRRAGAVVVRRRSAGRAGHHRPAAGFHRQARGDHLRARPGRRTGEAGPLTRRFGT